MGKYMKSWNGYEVVDEKARKDIEKLDINTNIHLDNIEEKYDESLLTKLTAPQTAKVGQIFRVQEVNEDGRLTLEAVDMPSGGGGAVDDVQIDGTSIVGEDGVAEIPQAEGNLDVGLIGVLNSLGFGILKINNKSFINAVDIANAQIDDRYSTQARLLKLSNLDYAVQAAMGAPIGDGMIDGVFHYPAWPAETQAAARARMGIGNFELLNDITLTEITKQLDVTQASNGDYYNYKMVIVFTTCPKSTRTINAYINAKSGSEIFQLYQPSVADTLDHRRTKTYIKKFDGFSLDIFSHTSNSAASNVYAEAGCVKFDGNITGINFYATGDGFDIGTNFKIYGVKA